MTELELALSMAEKPYVLLGVGIPGSGKTTLLSKVGRSLGIVRISPDDLREQISGDAADQSVNSQAWDLAYNIAKNKLNKSTSVIIDATHTEAWRRPDAVSMYRSYGAAAVIAAVIKAPLDVAMRRNSERDRVVPEHAMVRMNQALENNPVSIDEGFDVVINIDNS